MILKYKIIDNKYSNIKEIAKDYFQISQNLLSKLKSNHLIFKNEIPVTINESFSLNDIISFNLDFEEESDNIIPTKMDLNIIYEDDSMLIVEKPAFIAIHPSINHYENSLSNGIKYYFEEKNIKKKIRPVIRLDRDTSGLVIFAKNEYIQEILIRQMKSNVFKKFYLGVIQNTFSPLNGTINLPISRKEGSIIEREVNENGQNSITHYKTIKTFSKNNLNYSLVEFNLETGRTHQIRVHTSFLGHPLLGDSLYNGNLELINRQALHCYKLEFIHPISKKNLTITCKLPNDILNLTN